MKEGNIINHKGIDLIAIKVEGLGCGGCDGCYFIDRDGECYCDDSLECYNIETGSNLIFKEVR